MGLLLVSGKRCALESVSPINISRTLVSQVQPAGRPLGKQIALLCVKFTTVLSSMRSESNGMRCTYTRCLDRYTSIRTETATELIREANEHRIRLESSSKGKATQQICECVGNRSSLVARALLCHPGGDRSIHQLNLILAPGSTQPKNLQEKNPGEVKATGVLLIPSPTSVAGSVKTWKVPSCA